jgi:hypothetical protein
LNFANSFLTLSFVYGNDSYFDRTTSVNRQTYQNKKRNLF